MSVVKTSHTSWSDLGNAIVAAGFASSCISTTSSITLSLINHKYGAMKIFQHNTSYKDIGCSYGTLVGSTYTAEYTLKGSYGASELNTADPTFLLYCDAESGWFLIGVTLTDALKVIIYHGKLSDGSYFSFASTTSTIFNFAGCNGGAVLYPDNNVPVTWQGLSTLCSINNYYVMTDLLLKNRADNNIISNSDTPLSVVGIKWIGVATNITSVYGDCFYTPYVAAGISSVGSIFIPFS